MRRGHEELQGPTGDLQVWGKAHKLTLAIYRDTHDFPKEERFGLTSPNPAFVCFDRGELGGRLWPKIRRRDGPFHPDLDGFRSRAFLSSVTSERPEFFEEHGIFQAELRFRGSLENAIFAVAKVRNAVAA